MNKMYEEQFHFADYVHEFLKQYGLKTCFVAEKCGLQPNVLSRYTNHRTGLSGGQFTKLKLFVEDYERRMA